MWARPNSQKVYPEPADSPPPVYPGPPEKQILRFAQDDSQRGGAGYTSSESGLGRTGKPFWQVESYDHWVRNAYQFQRIISYIEWNPVSAGLVEKPEDWPWSSAHRQDRL